MVLKWTFSCSIEKQGAAGFLILSDLLSKGFHYHFCQGGGQATGFHRQAKLLELIFLTKKKNVPLDSETRRTKPFSQLVHFLRSQQKWEGTPCTTYTCILDLIPDHFNLIILSPSIGFMSTLHVKFLCLHFVSMCDVTIQCIIFVLHSVSFKQCLKKLKYYYSIVCSFLFVVILNLLISTI